MNKSAGTAGIKTPAGAAALRTEVTNAIIEAARQELTEVGFARFSMDNVAKRAGAGKAALYRRWPSRQALIVEMVRNIGVGVVASPDTGSLEGDLNAFLDATIEVMSSPFAVRVLPEIHSEMARDPVLQKIVSESTQKPRRANVMAILRRAQARGELPGELDEEFAVDVIAAPLYWRLTIARRPITPKYLRQLVPALVAALKASAAALV